MRKNTITEAIIRTLCYAQVFSYPLTISELWKYLICDKKVSKEDFILTLHHNRSFFEQVQDYIVLPGDRKLITQRSNRMQPSRRKLGKALWISHVLSYIPTVKLIAISGSLSMHNAKPEDDIDLFIISSKNRLWTTRLLVTIVLLLIKEKRKRAEKFAKDKICPNMFISEDALKIKKQDLYTAHEVAQMKVLFSKDNIYTYFLQENTWVLKYLPNVFAVHRKKRQKVKTSFSPHISLLEHVLFKAQYYYMRKRITNEKIKKNLAAFHPIRRQEVVLSLYYLKTKVYLKIFGAHRSQKNHIIHAVN